MDLNTDRSEKIIALAGNPNVGKSTVFNALTNMNQHTGNWTGKTVENAVGQYRHNNKTYTVVDIPGTYSLHPSSAEEEVARDFICFDNPDLVVVVVDATCLERNLGLVLQVSEITNNIIVCVNLLDEACKKGICVDINKLSETLGFPVVGTCAKTGEGLEKLKDEIEHFSPRPLKNLVEYNEKIARVIEKSEKFIRKSRWLSVNLPDLDINLKDKVASVFGLSQDVFIKAERILPSLNITKEEFRDNVSLSIIKTAEKIFKLCTHHNIKDYNKKDRAIDKVLTSKITGIPIMLIMVGIMFWLTITGANYPSELLSKLFVFLENKISQLLVYVGIPEVVRGVFVDGMLKTLGWVVAVMLPPMAIFFPLFTLLEDSGFLPRLAFNMDRCFKSVKAHGKQALTMCMGFGCNACGVTGCRIIDSPRERLIAVLTNSFVPCNGRFPTLIAIVTMFITGFSVSLSNSILSVITLILIILISVLVTLAISKLLSATVLKGMPSSFVLELPSYRKPQVVQVLVRSLFDRTLHILGRAVCVAAPAGIIIWMLANVFVGDKSLLIHCSDFLNPIGEFIGLDGAILLGFILGFPANEIVLPIILMVYLSSGIMTDFSNLSSVYNIFIQNGWTFTTAICMIIFTLFHFPCSTTMITIYKETRSFKWTLLSFALPLLVGIVMCFITSNLLNII